MDLRKCKTLSELQMELESEFQRVLKEMNSKPGARRLLDIKAVSEILQRSEEQICHLVMDEKIEGVMLAGNLCFYEEYISKYSTASQGLEKEVTNG